MIPKPKHQDLVFFTLTPPLPRLPPSSPACTKCYSYPLHSPDLFNWCRYAFPRHLNPTWPNGLAWTLYILPSTLSLHRRMNGTLEFYIIKIINDIHVFLAYWTTSSLLKNSHHFSIDLSQCSAPESTHKTCLHTRTHTHTHTHTHNNGPWMTESMTVSSLRARGSCCRVPSTRSESWYLASI